MPTFTVHQPPLRDGQSAADPERFVFVRDGFYFWAFVVAPVWLLLHRLWLVFVLYVVAVAGFEVAFWASGLPLGARMITTSLLGLLFGLEAASLWRWTLSRRRWKNVGTVVADDEESAERRFFQSWVASADRESAKPVPAGEAYAAPVRRGKPSSTDVIGLFPEPPR